MQAMTPPGQPEAPAERQAAIPATDAPTPATHPTPASPATARAAQTNREGQAKPKIVAGIPAYNEEKYIAKVVLKTMRHVDEVIVVDDGSKDMTAEIAEKLGATVVRHPENRGYGAALATIFNEARKRNADILVILDADDQHDPDEIPKLVEPIIRGEADIVVGSRFRGKTNQPLWRRIGVKIITWLTKKAHNLPHDITDAQSGYRAYNNKTIQLIQPQDTDMGASIDILAQAAQHKLRIKEVPVTIRYHQEASTQNPVTHAARVITRIIETVAERHPLLYLGLPGAATTLAGAALVAHSLYRFNQTRVFNPAEVLLAVTLFFAGLTLSTLATLLYTIQKIKRLGQ